jgi:hypothetical protein
MFGVIMAGSVVLAPAAPNAFGLLAAGIAALDLAYAPAMKAHEHGRLYRQFAGLAQKIINATDPDEAQLREWTIERLEIEAEEPPIFWAVEAQCHNEIARTRGWKFKPNILYWYQRLSKHFIRYEGTDFASQPSRPVRWLSHRARQEA